MTTLHGVFQRRTLVPSRRDKSSDRSYCYHRRGAVLAAALIAFLTITAALFALLKTVVIHHREVRDQRQNLQAQWLAEAGVDRAVAQLRHSDAYRGETWHVPEDELDGIGAADVEIHVEAVADHPDKLHVLVQASYPNDTVHRSQHSRETTVQIQPAQSN